MSSKLALKQLQSLQDSRERPNGDKEIKKAVRKKKRSNKKQAQARQQLQAAKDSSSKLEYYKSTTSAQKATAEIMSKLLGQPLPQEESDSDLDLDLDF